MKMTSLAKIKIVIGLFYIFSSMLLFAQEPNKPVLRLISKETIKKTPEGPKNVREISSENGKFKGIILYGRGLDQIPVDKFTLLDSKGNIVWEKKNCGPASFTITNKGIVIVHTLLANPFGGPSDFYFYDIQGNLVKRTEELTVKEGKFLNDADYLLVRTAKNDLFVFDTKGNFIQNYGPCRKFIATSEFKNLIVFYQNELRFYRNRKLAGKKNVQSQKPVFDGLVISPDGEYMAFLTLNELSLFDIGKVKKLWQVDVREDFNFNNINISQHAERVVVSLVSKERRPKSQTPGYIYVFNKKGEKLAEQKIDYTDWNIFLPELDISGNGKLISVKTDREIYKFELE